MQEALLHLWVDVNAKPYDIPLALQFRKDQIRVLCSGRTRTINKCRQISERQIKPPPVGVVGKMQRQEGCKGCHALSIADLRKQTGFPYG